MTDMNGALLKVERKVQFKQGFTGAVVAETDMASQECHRSVGYFLRKVGSNPYLFSVAHDQVEIDPELLTSKVDISGGKNAVAYKDGLNIYELVRRDDQVEVQWFGAARNIHFQEGTKYPCVRLHHLPVVRVRADKPTASEALAALQPFFRRYKTKTFNGCRYSEILNTWQAIVKLLGVVLTKAAIMFTLKILGSFAAC